jgi:hypothetical protein
MTRKILVAAGISLRTFFSGSHKALSTYNASLANPLSNTMSMQTGVQTLGDQLLLLIPRPRP